MKTIKISTTRTYTKTAVVEIPCPEDLPLENVFDYLHTNYSLYEDELENRLGDADLDSDFDSDETRYDVIQTVILTKHLYGGSL